MMVVELLAEIDRSLPPLASMEIKIDATICEVTLVTCRDRRVAILTPR
jgi:hypothetical protein